MDERDRMIVDAAGRNLGDVAVALLDIVHTLKNQPGFDRAAFN